MLDIDINSLKNLYTEQALLAQKEGFKIYIFGAGIVGQIVEKQFLEPYNIFASRFVEADEFYSGKRSVCGIPVIPYSEVDSSDKKVLLLVAYCYSEPGIYDIPSFEIKGRVFVGDAGMCAGCRITDGVLDADFYISKKNDFDAFYDSLADEESKLVMEAFIKARITGDYHYFSKIWRKDQYFDSSVIDLNSIKNWVDCGAYTGDTYEDYLGKCFGAKGCSYLFEPDEKNVEILVKKYANNPHVCIIPKGAWNEKTTLYFADDREDRGYITSSGTEIRVDSIDNVLNDKPVDFIKMDIEGSEYNALLGAQKTIQNWAPTLAICVYHKKDDLLKIPQLIKTFRNDYDFFLRIYKPYSLELVLYAVKKSL